MGFTSSVEAHATAARNDRVRAGASSGWRIRIAGRGIGSFAVAAFPGEERGHPNGKTIEIQAASARGTATR